MIFQVWRTYFYLLARSNRVEIDPAGIYFPYYLPPRAAKSGRGPPENRKIVLDGREIVVMLSVRGEIPRVHLQNAETLECQE